MDYPTPRSTMVDVLLEASPLLPDGRALAREPLEALPDEVLQRRYERWERIRARAADLLDLLERYGVPADRIERHRVTLQTRVDTHLATLDALRARPQESGTT